MEYGGFWLREAKGNNEFSFEIRKNKEIYVPSLIESDISGIEYSSVPNFIEVEDGVEKICYGLKNIYRLKGFEVSGKEVYLFDNHNHAFFFWCMGLKNSLFEKGTALVHIDQHKDTREPGDCNVNIENLKDVSRYTNEVLNVGSFIKPAMNKEIFSDLFIVDSTYSMKEKKYVDSDYVLDIDLDFFSKDMDYIDFDERISCVKSYIENADFITIATSPYFIEQERAVKVLKMLFDVEKKINL